MNGLGPLPGRAPAGPSRLLWDGPPWGWSVAGAWDLPAPAGACLRPSGAAIPVACWTVAGRPGYVPAVAGRPPGGASRAPSPRVRQFTGTVGRASAAGAGSVGAGGTSVSRVSWRSASSGTRRWTSVGTGSRATDVPGVTAEPEPSRVAGPAPATAVSPAGADPAPKRAGGPGPVPPEAVVSPEKWGVGGASARRGEIVVPGPGAVPDISGVRHQSRWTTGPVGSPAVLRPPIDGRAVEVRTGTRGGTDAARCGPPTGATGDVRSPDGRPGRGRRPAARVTVAGPLDRRPELGPGTGRPGGAAMWRLAVHRPGGRPPASLSRRGELVAPGVPRAAARRPAAAVPGRHGPVGGVSGTNRSARSRPTGLPGRRGATRRTGAWASPVRGAASADRRVGRPGRCGPGRRSG
ncbi:hypothetical protein JD77_00326 [Micromonospora olivasterospora]|uniref:Uncharacterized protein n=1 Tax=Micromonospora olivasterospora TaxID=1880 RepID=A0A562I307_MICOL|nr:hypothetical protein JD77_00326 [Micromonospora olivasterospora]